MRPSRAAAVIATICAVVTILSIAGVIVMLLVPILIWVPKSSRAWFRGGS